MNNKQRIDKQVVLSGLKPFILKGYWYLVSVYLSLTVNGQDSQDLSLQEVSMDEDEEVVDNRPTHKLIPAVRVYVGAVTPDGDFVTTEELEQWLSQAGPKQTVVDLLDSGIGSIFVVDHHSEERVI